MKNWFMKQPQKTQNHLRIGAWVACGASFLWIRILPSGSRNFMGYLFLVTIVLGYFFHTWYKEAEAQRQKDHSKAQSVDEQTSSVFSSDAAKGEGQGTTPHGDKPHDTATTQLDDKDVLEDGDTGVSKGADDTANV